MDRWRTAGGDRVGRRARRPGGLVAAGILAAWSGVFLPVEGAPALEAGAGSVPITPAVETFEDRNGDGRRGAEEPYSDTNGNGRFDPVWLAGFGRGRLALGVHDDLWARCLLLRVGGTGLALVTLDLIGFTRDQVLQVRQDLAPLLGLPPEAILVASSHTHHGPDVQGLWGSSFWTSGIDEDYRLRVRERIREAARRALEARRPAQATAATTRVAGVVRDIRPPALSDERLSVLWLRSLRGEPIATLVNYGMHPEALDRDNRRVTSDYVGPLRRDLERRLGGTALFVNADLGGMQTPDVREPSFAEAERIGLLLAEAAAEAARSGRPLELGEGLRWASTTLELPMTNPLFHLARWLGVFREAPGLFAGRGAGVRVPCDLAMFRIGAASFVTVPGELFPEIGEELRSVAGGEHQFILGLTNHSIGYIVPEEGWTLAGYEERVSLGRRTAPLLMREWRALAAAIEAPGAQGGLHRKAEHVRRILESRHVPEGLVLNARLDGQGRPAGYQDFGDQAIWTGIYALACAERALTTRAAEDIRELERAARALHTLHAVTGGEGRLARGVRGPAAPGDGEGLRWFPGGPGYERFRWAGDVSKDQLIGFVAGSAAAHEAALALGSRSLTEAVASLGRDLRAIVLRTAEEGWVLRDPDGRPTRHGDLRPGPAGVRWNAVNALIGLAAARAAATLSGDPRLEGLYRRELVGRLDYPGFVRRWLRVDFGPFTRFDNANMAFLALRTLLALETEGRLARLYASTLRERLWEGWASSHRNPFFAFIALSARVRGDGPGAQGVEDARAHAEALEALRDYPWTLLNRRVHPPSGLPCAWLGDRKGRVRALDPAPVSLRPPSVFLWKEDPRRVQGGADDGREFPGVDYLAAYWLGRREGLVAPHL